MEKIKHIPCSTQALILNTYKSIRLIQSSNIYPHVTTNGVHTHAYTNLTPRDVCSIVQMPDITDVVEYRDAANS